MLSQDLRGACDIGDDVIINLVSGQAIPARGPGPERPVHCAVLPFLYSRNLCAYEK